MTFKYICGFSLLAFNSLVFADNFVPCGPPGAYISVGETQQQVLDSCGQPTNSSVANEASPNAGEKVRWYYTANLLQGENQPTPIAITQGARYIIQFIDGKVDVIYSTEQVYEAYDFCGPVPQARREVKRGDDMGTVQ